jgi:creatinine amidohydrolase/Fe(II)-dependent formamide hydrolase-like protein
MTSGLPPEAGTSTAGRHVSNAPKAEALFHSIIIPVGAKEQLGCHA